jgi:hypothetical protein
LKHLLEVRLAQEGSASAKWGKLKVMEDFPIQSSTTGMTANSALALTVPDRDSTYIPPSAASRSGTSD